MRDTEITSRKVSSGLLRRIAALTAIGMLIGVAPARAQSDDEPAKDDGLIGNLMRGLGATDGSGGINYRERSPLVVPRQLTLPQPEAGRKETTNWPKDPDVMERRAARDAAKKRDKSKEADLSEQMRSPSEPIGQARARTATVSPQPGVSEERRHINEGSGILSPSQLGVTSSLFGMFSSKRDDNVPFTGEPARESLTQPPIGYQTPASTQAYGISNADRNRVNEQISNPSGILAPGQF